MAYNLAQLQQLSRQAGWPENLVEKAGSIWMYESGGKPDAHNPSGEDSWGLAQINWPYHKEYDRAQLVNPIYNLQAAYAIYRREGWNAWYNSNVKYNNNYQGIAAQGRAVYAQTQGQPVLIGTNDVPATTQDQQSVTSNANSYIYIFGVAIIAGLILNRR